MNASHIVGAFFLSVFVMLLLYYSTHLISPLFISSYNETGTTYHLDLEEGSNEAKEDKDKGKVDDVTSMLLSPKYSNKLIDALLAWEVSIVESARSAVASEPSTICAYANCQM